VSSTKVLHVLMVTPCSVNLIAFIFKDMLKTTVCCKLHLFILSHLASVMITDFEELEKHELN
jgi:hypothetical protein